jgi:hypothetical protein
LFLQGDAATLKKDVIADNPKLAAENLANAYQGGRGEAAAKAVAAAAAGGGAAYAVGRTIAETSRVRPNAAPWLLRNSADYAVNNGHVFGFSRAIASGFGFARSNNFLPSFVTSITEALLGGGVQTRYAFGSAIATAVADGGDGRAAVAEATATAMCTGGGTAQAWAEAYAVAIEQNDQGCTVLKEAHAIAYAKCGPGYAQSWSKTEATSTILGYCAVWNDDGSLAGWGGK